MRILSTPWRPAGRSHNEHTHAVRPAADYVGSATDEHGRYVTVCGAFARRIPPGGRGHTEFVPGSEQACRSCIRLIGADPEWTTRFPLVVRARGSIAVRFRPPAERHEQYLSELGARRRAEHARLDL